MSRLPWRWQRVADLCAVLCWPFDHAARGKYGAQNDNGWIFWNGSWVHHTDLAATQAYWRAQGWPVTNRKAPHRV